jgi:metal-dependent amidase/aminoacylase/carboxypeptidase family protein
MRAQGRRGGGGGDSSLAMHGTASAANALQVTYRGVNAHAASNPWEGVNALDATVQG